MMRHYTATGDTVHDGEKLKLRALSIDTCIPKREQQARLVDICRAERIKNAIRSGVSLPGDCVMDQSKSTFTITH